MAGRGRVQSKFTCDAVPPPFRFALAEARFPNTRESIKLRALWRGIGSVVAEELARGERGGAEMNEHATLTALWLCVARDER